DQSPSFVAVSHLVGMSPCQIVFETAPGSASEFLRMGVVLRFLLHFNLRSVRTVIRLSSDEAGIRQPGTLGGALRVGATVPSSCSVSLRIATIGRKRPPRLPGAALVIT